jgi:hypothetical protein
MFNYRQYGIAENRLSGVFFGDGAAKRHPKTIYPVLTIIMLLSVFQRE